MMQTIGKKKFNTHLAFNLSLADVTEQNAADADKE